MNLSQTMSWTYNPRGAFSVMRTLKRETRLGADWYALTPFELIQDKSYYGGLSLDGLPDIGIKITQPTKTRVTVALFSQRPLGRFVQMYMYHNIGRWLGIWEDLRDFYQLARSNPVCSRSVERFYGMHEVRCLNLFENLSFCIASQRVTAGRTIAMIKHLCEGLGPVLEFDGVSVRPFPRAESISRLNEPSLRNISPLGYRAKYLLANARQILETPFDGAFVESASSDVRNGILSDSFSGIGPYSANAIDPQGLPLDSWSVPLLYDRLGISGRGSKFELVRNWFEQRFGKWRRVAFVYLSNALCGNEDNDGE